LSLEPISELRGEDPSSERWLEYYKDARARRRARGPQKRTREALRQYRRRQTIALAIGFVAVGVLVAIFYAVLEHLA
jgi:hypothetical protein